MPTLHCFTRAQNEGDLTREDLVFVWGLLQAEGLADILFHDGTITTLEHFLAFATAPDVWFYAARHEGAWVGIGFVNGFSSSANTALGHYCAFKYGRRGLFEQAGRKWLRLLHEEGGLETILAVMPKPYFGARKFAEKFGFTQVATLPGGLMLHRQGGTKQVDACMYVLSFSLQEDTTQDNNPQIKE